MSLAGFQTIRFILKAERRGFVWLAAAQVCSPEATRLLLAVSSGSVVYLLQGHSERVFHTILIRD